MNNLKASAPLSITGYALTNCLGETTEEVLATLFNGQPNLTPCSKDFPLPFTTFAGHAKGDLEPLPQAESQFDTRATRLLARPLNELKPLIDSVVAQFGASRIGIVLGTSTGGIEGTERVFEAVQQGGDVPSSFDFDRQHAFGGLVEFTKARTGITGPAYAVSTACSSSGKVFGCAKRLIQSGLCDAVLVGGSDSLCQTTLRGFGSLEVVSDEPCRPFCAHRKGLNIGEGAALVLIERSDMSERPSLANFLGVGESADAHHMSHPDPTGEGAIAAMNRALAQGGISPDKVDHINAHGTGTKANDEIEGKAIQTLFGNGVPVVSTKAYTGHMLGAGGASEAIFAIACLQRGEIPAAIGANPHDPAFDIFLPDVKIQRTIQYVLSNSFAFGGSNVSVLIGMPSN